MKSAILTASNTIEIVEEPVPQCPDDGILVKILACGVCGSDLRTFQGGSEGVQFPFRQGHEITGEVVESNYPAYPVGTRLMCTLLITCGECWYCRNGMQNLCDHKSKYGAKIASEGPGGFSQYAAYSKMTLEKGCFGIIPPDFDPLAASLSETASSVLNAQINAEIMMEDLVVVIGSGAIGCLHADIAHLRGAKEVMIVEMSQEKANLAKERGFSGVYNYASSDEDLKELIMAKTGGRGADVIICACPSGQAQQDALHLVRKRGKVIFFGGVSKASMVILDTNLIHYKEILIYGASAYTPDVTRQALDLVTTGRIDAAKYITHHYTLDKLSQAFADMKAGKTIKAVALPWEV